MFRNLDTTLLRTFITVAETGSMTAAANVLHVTQGAVSQQIRRLEEVLDCGLFHRDRAGLRLTPAGERMVAKAGHLLRLNDEIWAEMTARTIEGEVRVGVPYDLVGTCLAPAIKSFAEAYPHVDLSLLCGSSPELEQKLDAGEIDLAVIEEVSTVAGGERLFIDRLVWAGARRGIAYRKRPVPISLVADTCAFRPVVLQALRRNGLEWRTVFENGNIEATTATVRTDLAVTTWLATTVPPDLEILGPESGLPDLPDFAVSLFLPRRSLAPAARELAASIREGLVRYRQAS